MDTRVENLVPGMIINQDIYDKNNILVLPKGTVITDHIITHLIRLGITEAVTRNNLQQDNVLAEFNETYANTTENIKNIFQSVRYKKNIQVSSIEPVIDELLLKSKSGWSILPYLKVIENKDEYSFRHSVNVSILAMLMGKWLKYEKENIKLLGVAAILHDIGKILIPDEILNKPGKLTNTEYDIIKNHTKLGFQILKNSGTMDDSIKNVVLSHHERMDGSGYPFNLHDGQISEKSRIVAICDVYDAVTSKRVYKEKEHPLKGLKVILDNSYKQLDPYLCRLFLNNVSQTYNGCKAVLNDGKAYKIIRVFPDNPTKPWVANDKVLYDLSRNNDMEIVDII